MLTNHLIQQNKPAIKKLIIEEIQDDESWRNALRYALGVDE